MSIEGPSGPRAKLGARGTSSASGSPRDRRGGGRRPWSTRSGLRRAAGGGPVHGGRRARLLRRVPRGTAPARCPASSRSSGASRSPSSCSRAPPARLPPQTQTLPPLGASALVACLVVFGLKVVLAGAPHLRRLALHPAKPWRPKPSTAAARPRPTRATSISGCTAKNEPTVTTTQMRDADAEQELARRRAAGGRELQLGCVAEVHRPHDPEVVVGRDHRRDHAGDDQPPPAAIVGGGEDVELAR